MSSTAFGWRLDLALHIICLMAPRNHKLREPNSILRFRSSSPSPPGIYFVSLQRLGAMLVLPPSVAALGNGTWRELFSQSTICSLLSSPVCSCNCRVVNPCGAWLRKYKSLLVFCSLSLIVRAMESSHVLNSSDCTCTKAEFLMSGFLFRFRNRIEVVTSFLSSPVTVLE